MQSRWFIASCVIGLLIGCKQTNDHAIPTGEAAKLVDTSLLTGDPCEPPCWQGLTPGESTKEDVEKALPNLAFIDQQSVKWDNDPYGWNGWIYIDWRTQASKDVYDFTVLRINPEGVLNDISIRLDYSVKFRELVDRFGDPDGFYENPTGAESTDDIIRIVWLDDGLQVATMPVSRLFRAKGSQMLNMNSPIHVVSYAPPASSLTQFAAHWGYSGDPSKLYCIWKGVENVTLSNCHE